MNLSLLLQFRQNLTHGILASLISYIVLPFAAAIVLIFYYGMSLINISISISSILMFFETMIEQGKTVASQERKLAVQERQLAEQDLTMAGQQYQLAQQERTLAQTEHQLAEKDRDLAQKERDLTENRITSMLSQIRNHFIFNTLGVISSYCKVDPEKADEAFARFARYLRRNMHYLEEKGLIPFETEVAQIEDYVALEQMRFEEFVKLGKYFKVNVDLHLKLIQI